MIGPNGPDRTIRHGNVRWAVRIEQRRHSQLSGILCRVKCQVAGRDCRLEMKRRIKILYLVLGNLSIDQDRGIRWAPHDRASA
jgi:hypothetical protein